MARQQISLHQIGVSFREPLYGQYFDWLVCVRQCSAWRWLAGAPPYYLPMLPIFATYPLVVSDLRHLWRNVSLDEREKRVREISNRSSDQLLSYPMWVELFYWIRRFDIMSSKFMTGEMRRRMHFIWSAYQYGIQWSMGTHAEIVGFLPPKHAVRAFLRSHFIPLITVYTIQQTVQPMNEAPFICRRWSAELL